MIGGPSAQEFGRTVRATKLITLSTDELGARPTPHATLEE